MNRGENGLDRVVVPTVERAKASANLHGINYLNDQDALILSDVGAATTANEPGFDTDGKIFVIEDASTAEGDTEVKFELSGLNSLLGNPVGIAFDGDDLYVAEKALDVVLRFYDILSQSGAIDLAPSSAVTVPQPESVVLR